MSRIKAKFTQALIGLDQIRESFAVDISVSIKRIFARVPELQLVVIACRDSDRIGIKALFEHDKRIPTDSELFADTSFEALRRLFEESTSRILTCENYAVKLRAENLLDQLFDDISLWNIFSSEFLMVVWRKDNSVAHSYMSNRPKVLLDEVDSPPADVVDEARAHRARKSKLIAAKTQIKQLQDQLAAANEKITRLTQEIAPASAYKLIETGCE